MLTMDRQRKFTKDKYCWVKVNENMRNRLIKGGKVYEMTRTQLAKTKVMKRCYWERIYDGGNLMENNPCKVTFNTAH